jgi:hypothetical protein
MSVGKHALLGGLWLWVVEAASGWIWNGLVTSTATNVAASVNWALTWAASQVTPYLAGPLAPFAVAAGSLWNWSWEYAERWLYGMTEKTALNYGIVWGLGTAAWLWAAPAIGTALTMWGVLWAGKHLYQAGIEFWADPLGNIWSAISAPFRWTWSALNSLRGRWAATTA